MMLVEGGGVRHVIQCDIDALSGANLIELIGNKLIKIMPPSGIDQSRVKEGA